MFFDGRNGEKILVGEKTIDTLISGDDVRAYFAAQFRGKDVRDPFRLGGDIDALAFVSSPESALVRMLLQTPGIRLLEFPQADAYARRFEFLTSITMPRGTERDARCTRLAVTGT